MEGLGVDGRIILKHVKGNRMGHHGMGLSGSEQEHVLGPWLMTNRSSCAKTILSPK
jgi:hypothetical protein